jgi:hypothetical protein
MEFLGYRRVQPTARGKYELLGRDFLQKVVWLLILYIILLFLLPKTSCELNCMSKGFSCNFLDLAVRHSPQGLSCDIFDKCSQPEYGSIEMIRMPHVHSNISMTAKLGVINSQF